MFKNWKCFRKWISNYAVQFYRQISRQVRVLEAKTFWQNHVGTKPNMSLTWSQEFNDENDDLTRIDDDENGEMVADTLFLYSHAWPKSLQNWKAVA